MLQKKTNKTNKQHAFEHFSALVNRRKAQPGKLKWKTHDVPLEK